MSAAAAPPAVDPDAGLVSRRMLGTAGVLALLDNRITKTRYGQIFFDSLPDYGFTTNREDVRRFFHV